MDGLGKGIAIAGIWIGVGIVGATAGADAVVIVSTMAMIATFCTALFWKN